MTNIFQNNIDYFRQYINVEDVIPKIRTFENEYDKYREIKSILIYEASNYAVDPKVTIAIPTLSRYDILTELLDVLDSQNGNIRYQIIIVDNCGKQNKKYMNFVKQLSVYTGICIKYYVNEFNIGMIGNWNRCVELSRTPFVSFIHDDDLVDYNYITEINECLTKLIKRDIKFGIIKVKYKKFSTKKEFDSAITKSKKYSGRMIELSHKDLFLIGYHVSNPPTCGMIINKEALIKCGGFTECAFPSSDFLLGFQMFRNNFKIYETNDILGFYRISVNESLRGDIARRFCIMDSFLMSYFGELYKSNNFIYNLWYKNWIYSHAKILIREKEKENIREVDVLEKLNRKFLCKIEIYAYKIFKKIYEQLMKLRSFY